jgi:hypothetical protein
VGTRNYASATCLSWAPTVSGVFAVLKSLLAPRCGAARSGAGLAEQLDTLCADSARVVAMAGRLDVHESDRTSKPSRARASSASVMIAALASIRIMFGSQAAAMATLSLLNTERLTLPSWNM